MVVLKRWPALCAAALALAAGCMLLPGQEQSGLAFSHRLHLVDQGLECENCHEDLAMSDQPGMPSVELCELCHEEIDPQKAEERRIATLFEGERFRARRVCALDEELVFSHLRHVDHELECGACHTGIETNERVGAQLAVSMDACVECHQSSQVASECRTCHTSLDRERPPSSHRHGWRRLHGEIVRACSEERIHDCSLCHEERTCVQCHQLEPPRSHNAYWRLRAHGLVAAMDRASCATCHQSSDCDSCHQEMRPVTHRASWGSERNAHCVGCHLPLRGESCFTCHRDTPSHLLATPKPDWHSPVMNCRQCHIGRRTLPHADNGTNCNSCHP